MSIIENMETIKRRMHTNDLLIKNLHDYNKDLKREAMDTCACMYDCKECPFYDGVKSSNLFVCHLMDR